MSETMEAAARPVDTGKISERRKLRFESIDEVLAEVDRLVKAERAGRLGKLGNWTLGHLARWAEYSYAGTPMKVPFFIKWIIKRQKQKFLYEPMRPGVRIPRVPGGSLAIDPMSLDEGLERIRRVMERLKVEAPTMPHSLFGPLTHEEWIASQLRHAELHLGFLVPE